MTIIHQLLINRRFGLLTNVVQFGTKTEFYEPPFEAVSICQRINTNA